MILLEKPLELVSTNSILTLPMSFNEKIPANYSLLSTQFVPKDLFLLLSSPLEFPEINHGITMMGFEQNTAVIQNLDIQVLNHMVNRILLSTAENFTYQDQVYISSMLQKLGITDVSQFMSQIHLLFNENKNIHNLLNLYEQNSTALKTLSYIKEEVFGEKIENKEGIQGSEILREQVYQIHQNIYERLDTVNLYNIVSNFQKNTAFSWDYLWNNELKLAEQVRMSKLLTLSNYKQSIYKQDILPPRHINQFEWGIDEKPTLSESDVFCGTAKALLSNIVEQVMLLRTEHILNENDFWINATKAYSQTAENIVSRYISFHQEDKEYKEQVCFYGNKVNMFYETEENAINMLFQQTLEGADFKGNQLPSDKVSVKELFAAYSFLTLQNLELKEEYFFSENNLKNELNILNLEEINRISKQYFNQNDSETNLQINTVLESKKEEINTLLAYRFLMLLKEQGIDTIEKESILNCFRRENEIQKENDYFYENTIHLLYEAEEKAINALINEIGENNFLKIEQDSEDVYIHKFFSHYAFSVLENLRLHQESLILGNINNIEGDTQQSEVLLHLEEEHFNQSDNENNLILNTLSKSNQYKLNNMLTDRLLELLKQNELYELDRQYVFAYFEHTNSLLEQTLGEKLNSTEREFSTATIEKNLKQFTEEIHKNTVESIENKNTIVIEQKSNLELLKEQIRFEKQKLLGVLDNTEKAFEKTAPMVFSEEATNDVEISDVKELHVTELTALSSAEEFVSEITDNKIQGYFSTQIINNLAIENSDFSENQLYKALMGDLLFNSANPYIEVVNAVSELETSLINSKYFTENRQQESNSIEKIVNSDILPITDKLEILEVYSQMLYYRYDSIRQSENISIRHLNNNNTEFSEFSENSESTYNTNKNLQLQRSEIKLKELTTEFNNENIQNIHIQNMEKNEYPIFNKEENQYNDHSLTSVQNEKILKPEAMEILRERLEDINQNNQQILNNENIQNMYIEKNEYAVFNQQQNQYNDDVLISAHNEEILALENVDTLRERLEEINRQNTVIREKIIAAQKNTVTVKALFPERRRTIEDSILALDKPEMLINKILSEEEESTPKNKLAPSIVVALENADESTRKIYEEILLYEQDPQKALERGILREGNQGMLSQDILNIESYNKTQEININRIEQGTEYLKQASENIRKSTIENEQSVVNVPTDYSVKPRMVHKPTEDHRQEEIISYLESQTHTQEPAFAQTMKESIISETVESTELNRKIEETIAKSTEDMNQMIEQTLARQMSVISEKVYSQMERKLTMEQARRGRY